MKRNSTFALISRVISIFVLSLLTVSVYSQGYYIYKIDGTRVKYLHSEIDSIVAFSKQDMVTVTTGEATKVTVSTAQIVENKVVSRALLTCGIIYGTQSNISATVGSKKSTTSKDEFSVSLDGLEPSMTYYYRAYAVDAGEYVLGDIKSFKTLEPTTGKVNGYEWVDLGLPSGLKWATCNVGASKPEQYGYYFAWGETSTKSTYTASNSLWYKKTISQLQSAGVIDADGNLTATYDAATAKWGGSWRMPTNKEVEELYRYCTSRWTTQNGVKGRIITSDINGNSIFLPAAGWRDESMLVCEGTYGTCWTSSVDSHSYVEATFSYVLRIEESEFSARTAMGIMCGRPIRAVTK